MFPGSLDYRPQFAREGHSNMIKYLGGAGQLKSAIVHDVKGLSGKVQYVKRAANYLSSKSILWYSFKTGV